MTEFFSDMGDADEFAMPGDDALAARLGVDQPTPTAEAADTEPEAADDRPRNPDGTFAKKQQEDEPEDTATEPEAEPELILGKFKSQDELAAAYAELESFKGRQSNEISELRRALEERFESLEQQAARPAAPSSWDDLILDNPATATKLAYQHGDMEQVRRAAAAWEEQSPGAPELWAETVRIRAEMDERLSKYDQALAPVQQHATNTQLQTGVAGLTAKYPEIGDFIQGADFAQLAEQIPLAKKALTEGAPDEVVSAIETIYLIHRGRASDNLKDAARDVARTAAAEAQTMREEAFVASATATTAAPRMSRADELAAGWDDADKVFESGWNL